MSQPPVHPSSGYPHPDPRSRPGYRQTDRQPGYPDGGQPSDRGYGQYGQPGYPDGGQPSDRGYGQPSDRGYGQPSDRGYGQPSDRGYGQYGQPGYQDSGQPPNRGYGQPTGRVYSGHSQPSAELYSGYPQSPVPPAPKKSNAGKIVLVVLAVLVLLGGGGSAVAYFAFKDDVKDVVEASQTRLVAPETLAGRPKITDPQLQALADELVASTKKNVPAATSTIGAFYGNPAKQDMVMIAGASALIADPAKELDKAIAELGAGGLTVTNAKSVEPGPLGGVAKCGDANAEGTSMGVCAWADRGCLAVMIIYFKTGDQAKAELVKIRGEVEQRS